MSVRKVLQMIKQHNICWVTPYTRNCTLMALREPLNNMLWEETSVHTGLSWARIVLTFCRVWMSHTFARCTVARCQKHRNKTFQNMLPLQAFFFKKKTKKTKHWVNRMLLTMMVQSAEPLYSLFLWRQKKIKLSHALGKGCQGHESYDPSLYVYMQVCILLPLDTQSQYDAIMTLKGFLTLVGGAGVPYLKRKDEMHKHPA